MSTLAISPQEQTLKNLLTAFNGESNASARYVAFAVKADAEGYLKIGSLFRAVSRSEQIHAANHAGIIHKMGGTPQSTIDPVKVMSTVENLQAAIEDELYEVNVMYPGFMKEAEAQMLPKARRTFRYAFETEKDHVLLFTNALEHVRKCVDKAHDRLSHPAVYYVCPECGFTASQTVLDHCPVCSHARDEFELVS